MTILYSIALLLQILVISIYLPGRVLGAVEGAGQGTRGDRNRPQQYLNRNRFAAIVGLVPMAVAWLVDLESSVAVVLLVTGLYFFLQVAALVVPKEAERLRSGQVVPQRASRPLMVGAVAAYTAYVAAILFQQSDGVTTQWAKIQVLTLANAFFVFLVVAAFMRLRRASTEDSRDRRGELGRSINGLASVSIGLSVYFFGKEILFDLHLTGLRPTMMSVFLLALALLTVHSQLGTSFSNSGRPDRLRSSASGRVRSA